MKYKHIDSALHNFGHSFVSLMNYVDEKYICDLLDAAARDSVGSEVRINFSGEVADLPECSEPQLAKSFEYWKTWLPELLERQNVTPSSLSSIVLRYRLTRMGREILMEAVDDRGKHHKVLVQHTL
jgi:hypothetical protein